MNKTGFGFLRLPRLNAEDETSIDFSVVEQMVDRHLELGGTYFDTAYTYLGGASEKGIRRCLTQRYPRERYRLAALLRAETAIPCTACNYCAPNCPQKLPITHYLKSAAKAFES